jgi:SNF2 family DNA or RNA helicase
VGINLTAADYVFLIDPWWNPAVEAQAVDRAHRIGRVGRVIAYRFLVEGTVEERVLHLQSRKRALVENLISTEGGSFRSLEPEDILELFS